MIVTITYFQKNKLDRFTEAQVDYLEDVEELVVTGDGKVSIVLNEAGHMTMERYEWVTHIATEMDSH